MSCKTVAYIKKKSYQNSQITFRLNVISYSSQTLHSILPSNRLPNGWWYVSLWSVSPKITGFEYNI